MPNGNCAFALGRLKQKIQPTTTTKTTTTTTTTTTKNVYISVPKIDAPQRPSSNGPPCPAATSGAAATTAAAAATTATTATAAALELLIQSVSEFVSQSGSQSVSQSPWRGFTGRPTPTPTPLPMPPPPPLPNIPIGPSGRLLISPAIGSSSPSALSCPNDTLINSEHDGDGLADLAGVHFILGTEAIGAGRRRTRRRRNREREREREREATKGMEGYFGPSVARVFLV